MCDSNCKFETMTKEQILAAIAQAVETGSVGDVDTGFVTKVREQNTGNAVTIWAGTRAQYNAIETKKWNCLYIITDDTTGEDIVKTVNAIKGVDFTQSVRMTNDPALSSCEESALFNAEPKLFVYNPTTGIVNFSFNLIYDGNFSAGNRMAIRASGLPYAPSNIVKDVPVLSGGLAFSGYLNPNVEGGADIMINVEKSFKTKDDTTFSGWYYAGAEV
jgi:hypothetical protein